jgi:hypothetical protein
MRRINEPPAIRIPPSGVGESGFVFLIVTAVLAVHGSVYAFAQSAPGKPTSLEPPAVIVQRMVQQNELRAEHLRYFTSQRHYHVAFHGLGREKTADMHVQATYIAGSGKSFQIIDESGSHVLINHVLKRLLETEKDDSREQKAALTPSNAIQANIPTCTLHEPRASTTIAV